MNATRILTRSSLALALMALAACQTAPVQQEAATQPDSTVATPSTSTASPPPTQSAAEQGAPVAVFLADTAEQKGWRSVQVGADSKLFLDPQPVITRDDLTGVQAGANQQGVGLLALMLSDDARSRIQRLTTQNPKKRLALVVGSTLMAAPSYSEPVTTGQLIFPVGTEDNATAAARAIAGVSANGAPSQGAVGGAEAAGASRGAMGGSGLGGSAAGSLRPAQ
jgi:Preprotein translocase subunit SecD